MRSSMQALHQMSAKSNSLVRRSCGECLSRFYQEKKICRNVSCFSRIFLQTDNSNVRVRKFHKWGGSATGTLNGTVLTKQIAKELAVKLTSEERETLITALQECQSQTMKAEYEGKLAAFRWRSKFGRPSKVPSLGDVDPTGSYCTVPEDWLLRKYAETVPPPTRKNLIKVMLANAIPFIGFGFLDNFVMIVAGDRIEAFVGSFFPISMMTAAALGNMISDILGIGSAYYVERAAQKIGFEPPKLSPVQMNLPQTIRAANMGRVIGVTIGCFLGMVPLLFLHQTIN